MEQFDLEAAALDTEAIMHEIGTRVRTHRAEALAKGLEWQAFADGLYPLPPGATLSRELYEAIRHLELGNEKIHVEMYLTETRLPLISGLVHRLRTALHELVLFYVNRLAAKETRVHEETTHALAMLVRDLEIELRDLRERVAVLEASQG
jgi:hypothetical protein